MTELNINGTDDPCYRYKMPAITTIFIGAKGGMTVISNITEICRALDRSPADIKRFFSKSLGLKANMVNGQLQLQGAHSNAVLQARLQEYIKNHVVCRVCDCPQTTVSKRGYTCSACGSTTRSD